MAAAPKATNAFTRDMASTPREVLVRFARLPFVHPVPTMLRVKYATEVAYTASASGLTSLFMGSPAPLKTLKATEAVAGAQEFYASVEGGNMPCESVDSAWVWLMICIVLGLRLVGVCIAGGGGLKSLTPWNIPACLRYALFRHVPRVASASESDCICVRD